MCLAFPLDRESFYENPSPVKSLHLSLRNRCGDPILLSEHHPTNRDSPSGCFENMAAAPSFDERNAQGFFEHAATTSGFRIHFLPSRQFFSFSLKRSGHRRLMIQPSNPAIGHGRRNHATALTSRLQSI